MPFEPGNQFWKARSSHGRSPKFDDADKLAEACEEYFQWIEDNPLIEAKPFAYEGAITMAEVPRMRAMTVASLCIFLDISPDLWEKFRKRDDFIGVTTRVDTIIRAQKFEGAAAGMLNANIIARDLGLAEKQEHSGPGGGPIGIQKIEWSVVHPEADAGAEVPAASAAKTV